jgi:soluble lytic murein transglycosylase-like protein
MKYGLNPRLLWTIAYLETRFNPKLVSPKGARGLMQLMPKTATRFGASDPHDPKRAIDAAARYMRYLMKRFGDRIDLALAAYNAGEGAVEAYLTGRSIQLGNKVINPARRMTGGVPPYRETRKYVMAGLSILAGFEWRSKFRAIQHQVEKGSVEDEAPGSKASKKKSIPYAGPSGQTSARSATPSIRLSISRDNR